MSLSRSELAPLTAFLHATIICMGDVQQSANRLEKLRGKPKDDKTAIAGGIAVFVVGVLLIGWGILFLKKISNENGPIELETQPYDLTTIRDNVGSDSYSDVNTRSSGDPFYSNSASQDPFGGSSY